MTFPLSPDREYYWDGSRWVRAVSADGYWRWDGRAWRPAHRQSRSNRRVLAVIGLASIAVFLVAGIGALVVIRLLPQQGLAGFGLVCNGSADSAGAPVASGDNVCGYRLGSALVTGSCDGASIPDGLRARKKTTADAEASDFDMVVDPEGCDLDTPLRSTIWLETRDAAPADVVVVADYMPHTDWGAIGITIGCNGATCLDLSIDPAGVYRLDEERAPDEWHIVARGALPVFTISHLNQLNRLVLRYHDRGVQAFLDGYAVLRTSTSLLQTPGLVSIYSDDRVGTEPALVHVRTLDLFAST